MQAGLYLIHPCRVWSKTSPSSISRFAIFASSTSITSDAVCLSFLLDESQKRLSIFMPVHMLAFCVTSFSFVSSIFSKSIFVVGIPRATIPYRFRINLAFLPGLSSSRPFLSTSRLPLYLLSVSQRLRLVEFAPPGVSWWWYYFQWGTRQSYLLLLLGLALSSVLRTRCRWALLRARFVCCIAWYATAHRTRPPPKSAIWRQLVLLRAAFLRL